VSDLSRTVVIPPKENGIGSKNFGLRSLFLIGDTICVRSGGRYTVLSYDHGTLPNPRPDPTTAGRQGVLITVPFGISPRHDLPAFDLEAEEVAFGEFWDRMASIVLKLARPNARRSLVAVTVRSERLARQITWKQTATAKKLRRATTLIERRVQATELDIRTGRTKTSQIREFESSPLQTPSQRTRPISMRTCRSPRAPEIVSADLSREARGHLMAHKGRQSR
jgi:hypothetical protein